jgi:hypothetical protein
VDGKRLERIFMGLWRGRENETRLRVANATGNIQHLNDAGDIYRDE